MESRSEAKEIVMSYLKALENRDHKLARSYMQDNFSFRGPLASYDEPEELLKVLEPLHPKYEVKKVFTDGDDVCLLYDLTTSTPPATVFTCGWYRVEGGKISSIRTIFDPRPYVTLSKKRNSEK